MAAASAGDVEKLAHRLYAQTGFDRDKTVDALVGLGYSKGEATAAVNKVAPAPEATPPAPVAKKSTPGRKPAARGASTAKKPRTPPAAPSASPGVDLPRPTLRLPRRPDARDVAGFGAGCLLFVLFMQYLSYGPGGPTGWLKAKFLNQPMEPVDGGGTGGAGADDSGLVTTRPQAPSTVNG